MSTSPAFDCVYAVAIPYKRRADRYTVYAMNKLGRRMGFAAYVSIAVARSQCRRHHVPFLVVVSFKGPVDNSRK